MNGPSVCELPPPLKSRHNCSPGSVVRGELSFLRHGRPRLVEQVGNAHGNFAIAIEQRLGQRQIDLV